MSDFKDFLLSRDIISNLMKWYGSSSKDKETNDFVYGMVELISEIDSDSRDQGRFVDEQNLDIMAKSYERIIPHSQRKTMGEFFTPIHIVDYILNSVGYTEQQDIENKKIIDLSCGSGSFLTRAVKNLVKKLRNSSSDVKHIIDIVKDNIFGIDINPIACFLCQINIYFTLFDLFKDFLEENQDYKLPIFNIFNKDTFRYNFSRKYEYVVGNPPYLFIRAIPEDYRNFIEKLPLKTNKGQYDYYQIFIELGIKILKENGKLGYIVPDSLLVLSNRKILRKFIYKSTKIKEIYYSGPLFDDPVVSNIILTLEKESNEFKRNENQILIKFLLSQPQNANKIPQNLIKQWNYDFLINLNKEDIRILDHMNSNFPTLEELIENSDFNIKLSRGVELGKEGEVIYCNCCQKFYPLPSKRLTCPECKKNFNRNLIERIILEEVPYGHDSHFKPFIYSMSRYLVNEIRFIDMTKKGINYKNLDIYKNRIVIRQLSQNNLICATYHDFTITSQSYYNLKVINSPILEFNHFYLLGLLNSQLLSYFFIKSFSSYKTLFPRILIEKLKKIPIKVPISKNERINANRIGNLVKKLLNPSVESSNLYLKLHNDLDSLIFDLYEIPSNQILRISKFIQTIKK